MLNIRRYQQQDNAAVKALHYAGLKQMGVMGDDPYHDNDLDNIERIYLNNRGDFLVGLLNSEIVAIGAIREFSDICGEIKRIRVRRDCQRQGCALTILLKLVTIASHLGYTELCLDTLATNLPSQRLLKNAALPGHTRLKSDLTTSFSTTKTCPAIINQGGNRYGPIAQRKIPHPLEKILLRRPSPHHLLLHR
ncbi:MAG: GNAT family N-acetyltransferase [Dehalococcoidales bacterium]